MLIRLQVSCGYTKSIKIRSLSMCNYCDIVFHAFLIHFLMFCSTILTAFFTESGSPLVFVGKYASQWPPFLIVYAGELSLMSSVIAKGVHLSLEPVKETTLSTSISF